ncbi:MAG: hypothetical protein HKN21_11805 [Candidatus Eisenbacteria bacterium]|uniref:Uncharacterized protein n=1 Tax=Eiseniibacteriota bacterium TaxID=2212470 RepID=A0A7Y2EFY8_UNCEI|nr:hypothetical protein [Candidatus Eisenbacteria bacterium]
MKSLPHPALALSLGPLLANALGFGIGSPLLLPFLGAVIAIPYFWKYVLGAEPGRGFLWMLFWAFFQSVALWILITLSPERAATVVHNGVPYAEEMMHWIRTGEGAEGSPRLFLPVHVRHFLGFCVLSIATVGSAGLVLGTWLLNYMNYYVVQVVSQSTNALQASLLAWHPWAIIRVVGFIATAVALAPLGMRIWGKLTKRPARRPAWKYFGIGLGLVLVDALLKTILAPTWQKLLKSLLST